MRKRNFETFTIQSFLFRICTYIYSNSKWQRLYFKFKMCININRSLNTLKEKKE